MRMRRREADCLCKWLGGTRRIAVIFFGSKSVRCYASRLMKVGMKEHPRFRNKHPGPSLDANQIK